MTRPLRSRHLEPARTSQRARPDAGIDQHDQAGRRAARPPDPDFLDTFNRSLKGPQQVALIRRLLGPLKDHRCLFISAGPTRGALPFHLRAAGGRWSWAGTAAETIDDTADLLAEMVSHISAHRLPFRAQTFERVVVHHLHDLFLLGIGFRSEIFRVLMPGGTTVWTAPNGNRRVRLRSLLQRNDRADHATGSAPSRNGPERNGSSKNGRSVPGLSYQQLEGLAIECGLTPVARGGCARLFTELADALSADPGPVLRTLAVLDHLIPTGEGHDLAIAARRPLRTHSGFVRKRSGA